MPAPPAHPALPQACRLDQLPVGQAAQIVRMDDADHAMMIRLKTMGMHPGRAVRMLRRGSRLIVQCAGTRMGLAVGIARHVRVQPVNPPPEPRS